MADRKRRDLMWAGAIFVALVVIGEVIVVTMSIMPRGLSEQAAEIDNAMDYLYIYSVPVMAFVLTALGYSVIRFRVKEPEIAENQTADHKGFAWGWFIVSVGLAALVFTYPGLTGLLALAEEPEPDIVMEVEGVQWHWNVTFPDSSVALENPSEILLPAETTIRFDLSSRDVIHSFWVPSLRVKQDAIPGQVISTYVTTAEVAAYADEPSLRLQCAELCGTGHARMWVPIRVVEQAEFEAWLAEQGATAGGMDENMDMGEDG